MISLWYIIISLLGIVTNTYHTIKDACATKNFKILEKKSFEKVVHMPHTVPMFGLFKM